MKHLWGNAGLIQCSLNLDARWGGEFGMSVLGQDMTIKYKELKKIKLGLVIKKQLICSNNLSLEMKKNLIKRCIWSFALCGSEKCTQGKK